MIRLACATLRRRPFTYFALLVAIISAVSISVATSSLVLTVRTAVQEQFTLPYKNSDVVGSIDPSQTHESTTEIIDKLRNDKAVKAVSYDLTVHATRRNENGIFESQTVETLPTDAFFRWRSLTDGRWPTAPGEIVVTNRALPLGSTVDLNFPGNSAPIQTKVVGHVQSSSQSLLSGSSDIQAQLSDVDGWARSRTGALPGGATSQVRIATHTPQDDSEVIRHIKSTVPEIQHVETVDAKVSSLTDQYLGKRSRYVLLLFSFLAVIFVVSSLVIYSAYSVIAKQREREFGLLRCVGASSKQLIAMVATESAVLAVIAGACGIPLGMGLAKFAGKRASSLHIRVPLASIEYSPTTILSIFVAGIILTVFSAIPASIKAIRKSALTAISAGEVDKLSISSVLGWLITSIAFAAISIFVKLNPPINDYSIVWIVLSAGCALLSIIALCTVLTLITTSGISALNPHGLSSLGHLSLRSVALNKTRTASLCVVVMAGTGLVAAVCAGQSVVSHNVNLKSLSLTPFDLSISSPTGKIPADESDQIAQLPQVAHTAQVTSFQGKVNGHDAEQFLVASENDLRATARDDADLSHLGNGTILIGQQSPFYDQVSNGQEVNVEIQGKPFSAKAYTYHGLQSIISRETLLTRSPGILDSVNPSSGQMLIRLDTSEATDPDSETVRAFSQGAAAIDDSLIINNRIRQREDQTSATDRLSSISWVLLILATLIAVLGILNTSLLFRKQQREFEWAVSLAGGQNRQIRRVRLLETLIVTIPGVAVATISGAKLGQWIGNHTQSPLSSVGFNTVPVVFVAVFAVILIPIVALLPMGKRSRGL